MEKMQSGRKGDKRFEGGEPDSTEEVFKLENAGSHSVGRCGIFRRIRDAAKRVAPGVKAA